MAWRRWPVLVALVIGCGDDTSSSGGSATAGSSGAADTMVGAGGATQCPSGWNEGPFALPDAAVGQPYEVFLSEHAMGWVAGVGPEISGDIPPGLETWETRLFGTPLGAGTFELELTTVEHVVPPRCDPPDPYVVRFTLVVHDADVATGTDSGGLGTSTSN